VTRRSSQKGKLNILQPKKRLREIATITTCAAVVVGLLGAAPSFADAPADDILSSVAKATPENTNNAAQVLTKETGSNAIDATVLGTVVTVPVDPEAGITLKTDAGTVAISLPNSAGAEDATAEKQGVVSYNNNNGSTSVPVVTADGSLQINTVITDASAPSRYSYNLTIPAGGQIVPAGQGFFIVNADNDLVTFIAEPWAKDANGNPVATRFELSGSTLTQVVERNSSTAYPVVADPVFVWETGLPALKWNKKESADLRTSSKSPQFCAAALSKTPPPINWTITGLCLANLTSITYNAQMIVSQGKCVEWLIGPGVIGSIGYTGGNCK
jgi:hypothetical protein